MPPTRPATTSMSSTPSVTTWSWSTLLWKDRRNLSVADRRDGFENAGFYSEHEFDFSPYKRLGNSVIELGRACVHRDHRSTDVLYLLWRESPSTPSVRRPVSDRLFFTDLTRPGARYRSLWGHAGALGGPPTANIAATRLRHAPDIPESASDKIPKLLRAYLAVGAKICGPPAIDREFKTIDFLTLMDLETLHPRVYARFMKI